MWRDVEWHQQLTRQIRTRMWHPISGMEGFIRGCSTLGRKRCGIVFVKHPKTFELQLKFEPRDV